jgi:predicted RNA-binding Zn ribbon-like protein
LTCCTRRTMDHAEGLGLAIANSAGTTDRLGTAGAFRAWLDEHVDSGTRSDAVLLRVGDFRALRAALIVAFRRTAEGSSPPDDVVDALNGTSAMAPMWPVLRINGTAKDLEMETSDASETTRILASIARSAVELLGGPDAARLRECPACGRFFLASRPRQVWCSGACGNRTRVARHRSRRAKVRA